MGVVVVVWCVVSTPRPHTHTLEATTLRIAPFSMERAGLTNFEDGEDITLEDAKRIADSIGLPVPEILPEFVVEARRRGRSLSAAGVEE